MMTNNTQSSIIYSELHSILSVINENDVKKIPKKCLDLIKNKKDNSYNPKYDLKIPLKEQNINQGTIDLLALLYLNYWCDSNEEKEELMKLFNANELKQQEELREKYNPDNIFKKTNEVEINTKKEVALIEYKEKSLIQRIIEKILKYFKNKY